MDPKEKMDGSRMNLEKTSEETEAETMTTPVGTEYPGWEFLLPMMEVAVGDAKTHHLKTSLRLVCQDVGASQRYP